MSVTAVVSLAFGDVGQRRVRNGHERMTVIYHPKANISATAIRRQSCRLCNIHIVSVSIEFAKRHVQQYHESL